MKKILDLSFRSRKAAIGSMLIMAFAVIGCDDSSSAPAGQNDEPGVESSSSVEQGLSSSEKAGRSSSSVDDASSGSVKSGVSSSSGETPKSYAEAKVMPSGTYDCSKYNCFSTEYLNQEFLELGKYGEILDERDGQVYKTVQIGEQIWMADNLNYYDTLNLSVKAKSWCYNDSADYCKKFGRLYTWAAAVDSVKLYRDKSIDCGYGRACVLSDTVYGICPLGWHLPNNMEWETLYSAVGGRSTAAKMLRTTSGWLEGGNGTDSVGFSALPAGYMTNYDCKGRVGSIGCFSSEGYSAYFWSATENSVYEAYYVQFYYFLEGATGGFISKNYAHSIRCVKD